MCVGGVFIVILCIEVPDAALGRSMHVRIFILTTSMKLFIERAAVACFKENFY